MKTEINSVEGMLKLLEAIRKTAIRDQIAFREKGFKQGENAWKEWKESQCRFLYYNCYVILIDMNKFNPESRLKRFLN